MDDNYNDADIDNGDSNDDDEAEEEARGGRGCGIM